MSGWEAGGGGRERGTYILLLLPVPRSIMMCLFLCTGQRGVFEGRRRGVPVEEHEGTWVVEFVHLRRGLVVRRPRGKGE